MSLNSLQKTAECYLQDVAELVFNHTSKQRAMIVYDAQSPLSRLLTQAYRSVLPEAAAIDFDQTAPEAILSRFETLNPEDWVILIQSTSFRLSQFRIRLELFHRNLKVIEHPHLARMREAEYLSYVDSLAYDPGYYRTVGPQLKKRIDQAKQIKIIGDSAELLYDSPFLAAKLNIGDYAGMNNIGGQFPIGEVFTEAKAHDRTNGTVQIFAYGDARFSVNVPEKPFTALIQNGRLEACPEAPDGFQTVLQDIREKEGVVWVRELGFGLNRALTRTQRVTDIGTYERMCGIHLSLGTKHLQYKKPEFPNKGGFHVDVFLVAKRVEIDGVCVYKGGRYLIEEGLIAKPRLG